MEPKIDIYQNEVGTWRWRAIVDGGEPIAESNASFLNRENAISNLLLLNQMINNMVGQAARQHFAQEPTAPKQLPPNQKERKS